MSNDLKGFLAIAQMVALYIILIVGVQTCTELERIDDQLSDLQRDHIRLSAGK